MFFNERRVITPATSLLFEAALGISSDLIMKIQLNYNMGLVRQDNEIQNRVKYIKNNIEAINNSNAIEQNYYQ